MSEAADEPDSTRADPLLDRTAHSCSSVDEWLTALRDYPAAYGLNERAEIGATEVQTLCMRPSAVEEVGDSPVCLDAYERGIATRPD